MNILAKHIKHYACILILALILVSCGSNDDSVDSVNINYPSGIDGLSKILKQKIDFASSINPDTISYQYNNKRISELTSSRNRYLIAYEYNSNNELIYSKTTNLIDNTEVSETTYTYPETDALTVVTQENSLVVDSTLWKLSELKGVEAISYSKKGGRDVVTKHIYTWNGETLEKHEIYEQINAESSFNNLDAFPDTSEKTIENIAKYYRVELLEPGSDYYLIERTSFESYNDGINILRYLSNNIPVTESQKIHEIQHVNLYDEERRAYFENTGYTTFTIDDKGYPIRLATGGAGAKKLDFIYE